MSTVEFDYSIRCRDCGSFGVVMLPRTSKPGKLCAQCLLEAIGELILMSEAEEILTTGSYGSDEQEEEA
ncbi:hypothetical protein LCGC14_0401220 [marine sediment metagenome]|uniref:Uncharacterized protein n=1 Tax=marine sediment metagenome TaxID=412755 RepID=A0A0F9T2H0_9ZZZZ